MVSEFLAQYYFYKKVFLQCPSFQQSRIIYICFPMFYCYPYYFLFQLNQTKQLLLFQLKQQLQNMLEGARLKVQNDTESLQIQQLLRSISDSRGEVTNLKQKMAAPYTEQKKSIGKSENSKKTKTRKTSLGDKIDLRLQHNKIPVVQGQIDNKSSCRLFTITPAINANEITGEKRTQMSSMVFEKRETMQFFDQSTVLRDIIKKHKIRSIVQNFVRKIKRVSVLQTPVEYKELNEYGKSFLWRKHGYELPQSAENLISFLSIIQIITFSFMFSVGLVYDELRSSMAMFDLQLFSCLFLTCQVIVNLSTVKYSSGKKLQPLMDIWMFYAEGYLLVDALGALVLLASIFSESEILIYLKIVVLLKIPQCLGRMQKLQVHFIKNLYNEQYWSLVKILLFNFCFAHIISILLTAMANLNPNNNWMIIKGIQYSPWIEKYSWSYYWANTIMLTVGFGDFVATNYQEAICLVFIQTFSCMAFAYNINCIGGIIQHILAKDAERSQKSKIFTKLNHKNKLSDQLSWKINNYIQQTAQLRKNFNYQEEKQFITNLPFEMKRDYLKQSNKNIFQSIVFFRNFVCRTLYNLAEKIEMRVSHPQEIIQHINDDYNLIILKAGRLGFVYRRPNFELHDLIMDVLTVKDKENPLLVNLQFIVRKRPFYQIKSMEYAIFYYLPYDKFIQILRQTGMDYQYFCTLKDRIKNIPDEFQLFKCDLCDSKHLKALCPKLHYIPYQQTIIYRHLHNEKTLVNLRAGMQRHQRPEKSHSAFYIYKKSLENVQRLGNIVPSRRRNRGDLQSQNNHNDSDSSISFEHEQTEVEREIKIINQKYKILTNEIIKQQFNKLIRSDNFEDEVWMLKNDVLYDFNAYFPEHNATNIAGRYVETAQIFRSQHMLKAHTSVMIQQIKSSILGSRKCPTKMLLRNSKKTKTIN